MVDKQLTTGDIFSILEEWAPISLAYDWDPIGLQVGSSKDPVKKMLITLDVDDRVVDEAIQHGVNLIIAHHPLLFRPMKSINLETPKGALIQKLLQHRITVYAAHTNLDIATGGVNDVLADRLGLAETEVLVKTDEEPLIKFVVYVPNEYALNVQQAIGREGAGHIGAYSHCSFKTRGEGSFKPLAGAAPYIGEIDTITNVEETRLETIVPKKIVNQVVQAAMDAHPYEEVAYDLYPTENRGEQMGLGRIGKWTEESSVERVIDKVKEVFELSHVRIAGPKRKEVRHVAIVGGSGEKYIHDAKRKGADVYITGDVTYHQAQEAEQLGVTVIDAGHYIEHVMIKETARFFKSHAVTSNIECMSSIIDTDPFSYR